MTLDKKDLNTLKTRGITEEKLNEELEMLRVGFPYLRLEAPATVGDGIKTLNPKIEEEAIEIWNSFLKQGGDVVKMVPASGAASRMFKELFAFMNSDREKPETPAVKEFFNRIEDFAFYKRLNLRLIQLYGKSIDSLIKEGRYKEIVGALLKRNGMDYGQLPKGLLHFHRVPGSNRTPFEEHLVEAAQYASSKGKARVHFTVSSEHVPFFQLKIEEVKAFLEHKYGSELDITYSVQKPSTDTIATLKDGTPYRENGELFFRPGGHGALIENLNDLDADVVFIKNIDNVVPDAQRRVTNTYKKVLGGILVGVKERLDKYCRILSTNNMPSDKEFAEMEEFLHKVLCISHDKLAEMELSEKIRFLFSKFNRPVRVCGMVRNDGEPGGGPFLVYNTDGTVSPQILESSQINKEDKRAAEMLKNSTHFNPVDLVCAIKDYKGRKFNLLDYVDKSTGFISEKSREGVEIMALELPGLWNGAMSDWNTIFVEVPSETFNPVKTVNDLLRPAHQS